MGIRVVCEETKEVAPIALEYKSIAAWNLDDLKAALPSSLIFSACFLGSMSSTGVGGSDAEEDVRSTCEGSSCLLPQE